MTLDYSFTACGLVMIVCIKHCGHSRRLLSAAAQRDSDDTNSDTAATQGPPGPGFMQPDRQWSPADGATVIGQKGLVLG